MRDRPADRTRTLEARGRRWLALEAWRFGSGDGLLYFVPLRDGEPSSDDREDRRALLEAGRELAELEAGELEDLLAGAVPLTRTERRLADREGRLWLAQSEGPVWAEGEVAAGLTGLVFTPLTGAWERRRGPGDGLAGLSEEDLRVRLERAGRRESASEGPGRRAGGPDGRPGGEPPAAAGVDDRAG